MSTEVEIALRSHSAQTLILLLLLLVGYFISSLLLTFFFLFENGSTFGSVYLSVRIQN